MSSGSSSGGSAASAPASSTPASNATVSPASGFQPPYPPPSSFSAPAAAAGVHGYTPVLSEPLISSHELEVKFIRLYFLYSNAVCPMVCKTDFYYAGELIGLPAL